MFQGSMVALVTPMQADGAIDYASLDKLIEFHIETGTDAIVAVGTTGESATLETDEHCAVIRHTVESVKQRVPVIVGTGSNSTQEAILLSRFAQEVGADACLQVTPYYNKPTQHGLYAHFKAIAEAVALPHILYNVPARTACDMLPQTVAQLSCISNIVGIKEATAQVERAEQIIAQCDAAFAVYSGDDATALDLMRVGARGVISVTANVAPKLMQQCIATARQGDFAQAQQLDASLQPLHEQLFCEANPIPVKWVLAQMGLIPSGIRLPLTPLSTSFHPALRDAMQCANLL